MALGRILADCNVKDSLERENSCGLALRRTSGDRRWGESPRIGTKKNSWKLALREFEDIGAGENSRRLSRGDFLVIGAEEISWPLALGESLRIGAEESS